MRSASLIPPPKASAPAGGFSVGLGLRAHLFLPLLGAEGVNSGWLYTEGSHLSGCPRAFANTPMSFKKHFFLYCMCIWCTCGDTCVFMFMCASAGMCAEVSLMYWSQLCILCETWSPYCSVLCSQASRSSSLQGLSHLHLSSCHRDTQDADTCYHAKLYVGPGDSNSKLHDCIANPSPAKPCPQPANRTLLKCLSNVLTGRSQAPLTKKTSLKR